MIIFQYNRRLCLYGLFLLLATSVFSCKMEEIAAVESIKQIQGSWRISKATRNGTDITEKFDFSPFRITFNENGSYKVQYPLPFIVSGEGEYTLDDPNYPFQIKFKEAQSNKEVSSSFDYPIVEGSRNLYLTFSVGCTANTYIYTLIKNNQ